VLTLAPDGGAARARSPRATNGPRARAGEPAEDGKALARPGTGHRWRSFNLSWLEWQILYRQALQLGRALAGERQLLDRLLERTSDTAETAGSEEAMEEAMDDMVPDEAAMVTPIARASTARAQALSTRELVAEIAGKASLLVKKEVELAKNEVKADLQSELAMAKAMAAGVVAGLLGLNALVVAVILALAAVMPGWLAALVVGGVMLVIAAVAGYVGWSWRVTTPLAMTRKTIREDVQWAKERVA
jgi:putative superfamily III holin-X